MTLIRCLSGSFCSPVRIPVFILAALILMLLRTQSMAYADAASCFGNLARLTLAAQLLVFLLIAQTTRFIVKRYLENRVSSFVILLYKFTYPVYQIREIPNLVIVMAVNLPLSFRTDGLSGLTG